jgi:ribosome biogenesis SPOUT family RNA methylase Rps3
MKYCIEHLEQDINEWSYTEYLHCKSKVPLRIYYNEVQDIPPELEDVMVKGSALELLKEKTVLLDPLSPTTLSPDDDFEYVLFGGILGDDPPQDHTGILRRMGFATRNLGPVQMTTDTAVMVTREVSQQRDHHRTVLIF